MRKSTKRIPIGTSQVRYIVTLTSDPVMAGALDMNQKQHEMLRTLADQPEMCICGPGRFDKLRMDFNGSEWVIQMESVTEANNGSTAGSTT